MARKSARKKSARRSSARKAPKKSARKAPKKSARKKAPRADIDDEGFVEVEIGMSYDSDPYAGT